jgi:CIC family chloride channel protein
MSNDRRRAGGRADGQGGGDGGAGPEAPSWRAWRRWLRKGLPVPGGFESSRELARWLLLGSVIGVVAGLGAVVFYRGLELATRLFLGALAGYVPPGTIGEGAAVGTAVGRRWALPLVTAAGGLVSGLLVFLLAPEAEGHGTDAAIDAIHRKGGALRPRAIPVKLVASVITIGTGGSAGREGPAAQISAGFGSLLGRWFLRDPQERRIAVAAGIGAGIGAIFRAPLGGAVLAAEILYVHDIEVEALIPSLIASIVGYTVFGAFEGYAPIFGPHPTLGLGPPVQLVYYAVLGVAAGVGGILYARGFYAAAAAFRRLRLPAWAKPALGGLAVGVVGIWLPEVLHTGYGWVQLAMSRDALLAMSPLVLVAIPLGKIAATSVSIGSGGSGGIFGPGMVIGGMLGAVLWRAGAGVLPGMPPTPAPFVIIGMMSLFGGIAHAPLAVMLMVAEMTGTLSLLAPAMIAVAVATAVVGDETIYEAQLRDRASSLHHRLKLSFPMLASLSVGDAVEPAVVCAAATPVREAAARVRRAGAHGVAVLDGEGRPAGAVGREVLERAEARDPTLAVGELAAPVVVSAGETLEDVMLAQARAAAHVALVADGQVPRGIATAQGMLASYRAARTGARPSPAAGIATKNVLPAPGVDSAQSRPP